MKCWIGEEIGLFLGEGVRDVRRDISFRAILYYSRMEFIPFIYRLFGLNPKLLLTGEREYSLIISAMKIQKNWEIGKIQLTAKPV